MTNGEKTKSLCDAPEQADKARSISIDVISVEREFFGTKLSLRLLDVENFGDNISNEESFRILLTYLEDQFKSVLDEESRIKRNPKFEDNRVHVLLYFVPPTGHGLSELDLKAMKMLGERVNIVPILAKADAYNEEELQRMKAVGWVVECKVN